jgi:hypothetical protein
VAVLTVSDPPSSWLNRILPVPPTVREEAVVGSVLLLSMSILPLPVISADIEVPPVLSISMLPSPLTSASIVAADVSIGEPLYMPVTASRIRSEAVRSISSSGGPSTSASLIAPAELIV